MDQVCKYGQMVLAMKVSGVTIKQMAKESSGMLMEIFMKENGRMTRLTAMEHTYTLMEQSTKDSGKMICKMDMG